MEEDNALANLDVVVRDQDEVEREINQEADALLTTQANERDQARLTKASRDQQRLEVQISALKRILEVEPSTTQRARSAASELQNYEAQLKSILADKADIVKRISDRQRENAVRANTDASKTQRQPNETRHDFLVRTGKITPFSKQDAVPRMPVNASDLGDVLLQDDEDDQDENGAEGQPEGASNEPKSHQFLSKPGFQGSDIEADFEDSDRPVKRRRTSVKDQPRKRRRSASESSASPEVQEEQIAVKTQDLEHEEGGDITDGSQAYVPDEEADERESSVEIEIPEEATVKRKAGKISKKSQDLSQLDDGVEKNYQSRLKDWTARRRAARAKAQALTREGMAPDSTIDAPEWQQAHPTIPSTSVADNFSMPGDIYPALFDYQKTGVQWLWELYNQRVGGIVGDEMGLGKTIQVIAFLAGLHHSGMLQKPVLVVCPATVMKQWVSEFHTWWPPFRVSILHSTGSGLIDLDRESRREDRLEFDERQTNRSLNSSARRSAQRILNKITHDGHVIVTTYSGLQTYAEVLLPIEWEYAVLDEGHKIRNPNAAVTVFCKSILTRNRIILSGTPIQNNLIELWSLFDFIFPMRLGNLVNFQSQFEIPIRHGSYANASNMQVQTAARCAEALKDAISPYLLQRLKIDVATDLPKKKEHILFCKLTEYQREAYLNYLGGEKVAAMKDGKMRSFSGIDTLRKICNHPDLTAHAKLRNKPDYNYGDPKKSGKMNVVETLLTQWSETGHKALLFSQQRIMLDILEKQARTIPGIKYLRMDGDTQIANRQALVDQFNNDPELNLFLLTTKVGGLGVNLTSADRVVIYDPDWNPSTDMQARERAYRLGQKREVVVYRLMIAGAIEEKIYQRQVFKTYLTNKILHDPNSRQTFAMKDLHDLFSLGDADDTTTETGRIFQNSINPIDVPDTIDVGVDKTEEYQETAAPTVRSKEGEESVHDQRILGALLAGTGLHSLVAHDQVVEPGTSRPDIMIINREAKRVAAEAVKALKKAEQEAKANPIGVPTWTGQVGEVGRPTAPPRQQAAPIRRPGAPGALAASSLLARMEARRNINGNNEGSGTDSASPVPFNDSTEKITALMAQVQKFMRTHNGQVPTEMLVQHFASRIGRNDERANLQFKAVLREIADKVTSTTGGVGKRAIWRLKPEYR